MFTICRYWDYTLMTKKWELLRLAPSLLVCEKHRFHSLTKITNKNEAGDGVNMEENKKFFFVVLMKLGKVFVVIFLSSLISTFTNQGKIL